MSSWTSGQARSTTVRRQHRRRFPPQYCAQCGATHLRLKQDHIVNLTAGGIDCVANLQWLCDPCHNPKTARERADGQAKAQARRGSLSRRYRDLEPHPGRIT